MNAHWFPLNLGVQFSLLPAAYYQLLHVGYMRNIPTNPLDQEVLAYFQVAPKSNSPIFEPELVVQPINMQRAALLIPGSQWSTDGYLLSDSSHTYPDHRVISLGANVPRLQPLSKALPIGTVLPPALHTALLSAWYTVLDVGRERILIPCFELLRAFYYQAGGKLVDYFFSRLPIEAVCWPIMPPTIATDFTAHFCVAAQLGNPQEARVLAELLFNSSYRTTIQRAHAYLAMEWQACITRHLVPEVHPKVSFSLGKEISVTAQGVAFTVGSQDFFWVSRLIPVPDWFSFHSVVYHPLQYKPQGYNRPFSSLAAFTDVLSQRWPTHRIPESTEPINNFSPVRAVTTNSANSRISGPPVIRAFPWAELVPPQFLPIYAEAGATKFLWARPGHSLFGTKSILPRLPAFQQLLRSLRKHGCLVQQLELNNPGRRFGLGRSVFPYACAPTSYTHLPDRRHRPLGIAHIEWGGGNFYVFYVLGYDRVVLFFRESLTSWTLSACNELLHHAARVNLDWLKVSELLPQSIQHRVVISVLQGESMQVIASKLHRQAQIAIHRYNVMADYIQQCTNLELDPTLPLTPSQNEQLRSLYQAANKKKYAGQYIGEPPLPY
jgi:hypothetical protein